MKPIFQYIATNNERPLRNLLANYGLAKTPTRAELAGYAEAIGKQAKGEMDSDLLEIHPDYKAFSNHFKMIYEPQIEEIKAEAEKAATKVLNAAGDKLNLATIQKNTEAPVLSHSRTFDLIAGMALATSFIALALAFKNGK